MFFKKQKPKEQEPTNQEPVNKFYETLKTKVDMAVSKPYARMDELREQIGEAEEKLSKEIEAREGFAKRRARLKSDSAKRALESQDAYLKLKVDLKKLRNEIEACDDIIEILQNECIPELKTNYDKVHAEFMEKLNDVAKTLRWFGVDTCQVEADKAMKHFEALVGMQLNYTSAWERIYKEFDEDFLKMYGASFTLPEILPHSITSKDIVFVQRLLEPERATLNHPLQTRPIEPVPVEPEPIKETPVEEKPVEDKPIETSEEKPAEESGPKYRRECKKCCEDFQTTEADVTLCSGCQKEANRLSLLVTTPDLKPEKDNVEPVTAETTETGQ